MNILLKRNNEIGSRLSISVLNRYIFINSFNNFVDNPGKGLLTIVQLSRLGQGLKRDSCDCGANPI